MEFQFDERSDEDLHICETYRVGDWIVFTCPKCPQYERRVNWRTREMKTRIGEGNEHIKHAGSYFPKEYEYAFTQVN